ncbi:hypothetical protein M9Y10_041080 [Tritrichomonas musculus]|uniref:Uncharacterized protein n=1 Tax=Tritrichomonas musculus TaxID=1915356 RepID=A0ABR2K3C8_9EUKA
MLNAVVQASNFTCRNAMTGLGCGIIEMFILGIFFLFGSFTCIYFLFHHYKIKKINKRRSPCDNSIVFFATMSFWMLFRSVISIVPFNYTPITYNIVFTNISAILFAVPLSFVILILCNILFTYRNPGTKMIIFFKMLFFIFLTAFLLIAVVISIANSKDQKAHDRTMKLWRACTDFLICFFFAGPAIQLVKEFAMKSINQKSSKKCLTLSTTGVAIFSFIFILRVLYNFLAYCDLNPIEHFIEDQIDEAERIPSVDARAFTVVYYFVFDFFAGCLGIAAVVYIESQELNLIADREYDRQRSDSAID